MASYNCGKGIYFLPFSQIFTSHSQKKKRFSTRGSSSRYKKVNETEW